MEVQYISGAAPGMSISANLTAPLPEMSLSLLKGNNRL